MFLHPSNPNPVSYTHLDVYKRQAFDLLDKLGIEYDRVSHDAAFNMELCAEVSRALDVSVCKNLFLWQRCV